MIEYKICDYSDGKMHIIDLHNPKVAFTVTDISHIENTELIELLREKIIRGFVKSAGSLALIELFCCDLDYTRQLNDDELEPMLREEMQTASKWLADYLEIQNS